MARAGVLLSAALLLFACLLTLCRQWDTSLRLPAMAASFGAYALPLFLGSLVLAAALLLTGSYRPWAAAFAALALVGAGLHVAWLAPTFTGPPPASGAELRVMNANTLFGEADADQLLEAARQVDVLVVEEMRPYGLERLDAAGLRDRFPYRAGRPADTAAGTMIFSRWPLTDETPLPISNGGVAATVGSPTPFRLIAVHPSQPLLAPGDWHRDLVRTRELAAAAEKSGPTLVVGDLNATRDHAVFRRLLGAGLRDAAEQAGSGWRPTWPSNARVLPPLIGIDHVLVSGEFTATRTDTVRIAGTDHRALIARLHLRT